MAWTLLMIGCPFHLAEQLRSVVSSALLQFDSIQSTRNHAFSRHVEEADVVVLHQAGTQAPLPEACRQVRSITDVPIIALAESYDEDTMLLTFEAGANDYIYPVYSARELLARIRARLRRAHEYASRGVNGERYELGNIVIDAARHEVTVDGQPVRLTPKEFDLLRTLAAHSQKAVSRQQLLREVWDFPDGESSRTLDVHIGRLRQKIEPNPANPRFILTVPGYGYKLRI